MAPFMRGYAPTGIPADACYERGALVADAVELHDALGGDDDAVLIGHDWGAEAAYGAAAFAPERWRRLVTLAIPPPALDAELFSDYEQLKRFFYIFYFQAVSSSDKTVWSDRLTFLRKLWQDWSPGYDAGHDLDFVAQALNEPARLAAALAYYRAETKPRNPRYASYSAALARRPTQPTLYLHGADDGCISGTFAHQALPELAPGSRVQVIDHAGHFPHLERPHEVNDLILAWVAD